MSNYVSDFMAELKAKNPGESEFHQAAEEVTKSLALVFERNPEYRKAKLLERIAEPERVLMFRVPWMDDNGEIHVNRGFRIEMNSAIGPYKGGLRFHPRYRQIDPTRSQPSHGAVHPARLRWARHHPLHRRDYV